MGDPAAHAPLPPSGAPVWGPDGCPANPTLAALYPEDQDSPEAREGTAAHFYVSDMLSGRLVTVGQLAPNGHPVDAEMIECGYDYIRDIVDTLKTASPGCVLRVEERVYAIETVHANNWGTPDCYLLDRPKRKLHLWDYKYGHRYVDAYGNWQCVNYVVAIFESEGIPPTEWAEWDITVTIAQPRNFHPDGPLREWHFQGPELLERWRRLKAAALAASVPGAPMVTGEHCRDCLARHACPALERVSMSLVDLSRTGQPVNLPPHALGLELKIIRAAMKRLGARAVGLEQHALAMVRSGQDVPFWKGDYSQGRTVWRDDAPPSVIVPMGEMYGLDLAKPQAALTPKQAIKAGFPQALVDEFSHTPRGALTLIPFDTSDVAKRFG